MSVEEDIGGLKADMRTVREQTSRIFEKIDELSSAISEHRTSELTRLSNMEDRNRVLNDYMENNIAPELDSLLLTRSRAKGWIAGVGAFAGLAAATITEIIRSMIKGGS